MVFGSGPTLSIATDSIDSEGSNSRRWRFFVSSSMHLCASLLTAYEARNVICHDGPAKELAERVVHTSAVEVAYQGTIVSAVEYSVPKHL